MSNYSSLKSAIDANIKANGRRAITGPVLNAILNAVVNSLGDGYLFRGVAIPSTNPGTPDQNVAYLAITEGTYTHMGGLSVTDGELSVFSYNGAWSKIPLALVPTKTSQLDNDLRFVTSEEMGESLSSKQDTIQDLSEIRSGAALGATAYQKPSAGIPVSDMTTAVQNSLELANSSVQAEPIGSITPVVDPSEYATKDEVSQLGQELISEIGDITIAGTLVAGTTANFIQGVDLKSGDKIYVTTTLGSGLSVSTVSLKDDAGNFLSQSLNRANNLEITLARDTTKLIVYVYGGHISAGGDFSVNIRTGVTHRIDAVLITVSGLATKNALMRESTMHLALNDGYYIDANGAVASAAAFGYYAIPVCGGATIRSFIAVNPGDSGCCLAFYDKDGVYINGTVDVLGQYANTEHTVTAPDNAVLIKISYRIVLKECLYVHIDYSTAIDEFKDSIEEVLSQLLVEHQPTNYSSLSFYSHTQNSTGLSEEITNTQIKITRTGTKGNDLIKVSMSGLTPGKEYRFRCDAAAFANSQSYVHIVDGNTQATLANCPIVDGKINVTFTPNSTVPEICIYLRYAEAFVVTFSNILISEPDANVEPLIKESLLKYLDGSIFANDFASANNIFDGVDPTTYGGEEMRVFKKGICIGDSLVKGTFNYNVAQGTEYAVVDTTRSYPQFLAKMLGITIDNVATGGVTTAGWWTEYGNGDYSGNDFVIIHLGINDILKNGSWNEASATALTNIINKFKSDNNGIKIFVCTGFPFTAYLNAGVALETALATFVEGLADANVILIDTFRYCHIDENVAYNNVHGTALGYWKLATELKNYISWYIHNHLSEFRAVQFIGTNYVL